MWKDELVNSHRLLKEVRFHAQDKSIGEAIILPKLSSRMMTNVPARLHLVRTDYLRSSLNIKLMQLSYLVATL